MKGIFNPLQRVQQVFFLGLALYTFARAIEEGRSDQSGKQDHYVIPSITVHGNKRIICRDGWIPARTSKSGPSTTFVCIKLYRNPSSWLDARDVCRAHHSFLVKLENRIGIKQNFLDQILRNEGIDHIWSGLHVDESKLIWDELQPNVIDSYVGQTELFGNVKRGWKWHPGTFDNVKNTCGAFAAGRNEGHKRAARSASPEEDSYYSHNYPNTIHPESVAEIQPDYTGYTESLPTSTVDIPDNHDDDLDNPELSSDDNSGTKYTTPYPENNKNDTSSKEVTEPNSKELTTAAPPTNDSYITTFLDPLGYTTAPSNALPEIVKRSTMEQELITSTTPSVQTTESTASDSVEDNSTATATSGPSPTASAPAKGTSSSTAATVIQPEEDTSSKEITERVPSTATTTSTASSETTTITTTQTTSTMATTTTTENTSKGKEDEMHVVSASTLPEEETVVSKSQTAEPKIVQPNKVDIPSISNVMSNHASHVQDIEPMIELEDCQTAYPFICYSDPIEELSPDNHCGNQWVSHENLDKCYKVIERPLSLQMAAKNCYDQGGRLADVFITFYGNVTALAFQKHPRRQNLGTHAWVGHAETRMDPQNSKCDAILGYSIAKVNCSTKLPSICEKQVPHTDLAQTESFGDFLNSPDKVKVLYMTTSRPGTILCPLHSSSPDDLILWYKDGVLIQDLGSVYLGMNSNTFKMNNQNRFSNTLKLDMTIFRRMKTNGRHRHVAPMLQGKYWCEVWRRRPFQRIKSMKFLIRYKDVITLFGTIQTTGVIAREAAYFNLMDTPVGLPKRIAHDLDFINNNISRIMTNHRLPLSNLVSELLRADNVTGRVEFFTYLQLSREVPETYKSQIVSTYLDNMNKMVVDNTAAVSRRWNLLPEVTKYIFISRTDICPATYLEDDLTNLGAHFPTTSINTTSMSTEICDGKAAGSARCIGNLEEGAYWNDWVIDNECGSFPDKPSSEEFVEETFDGRNGDEVELLYPSVFAQRTPPNPGLVQLDEIAIEDGNVEDVSDKMVEILSHSQSLTDEDITRIAKVMDKINTVTTPSIQVGKNLMTTVDKVLDSNDKVLNLAETENHAATRILTNLENLANKAKLGRDKTVRLVTPNVAMEVWDLKKDDVPVIGLGAIVAKSWSMPLTEPRIMTIRDRSDGQLEDFDVAIEIPEQLVKNRMKSGNSTRLTMFIYRKIGLFKSNSTTMMVNSPIISATVGGEKVENLSEKVRIVFRPFKNIDDRKSKTKCVYWDFEENNNEGGWSTRGCKYEGTLYDKDVCMCDHLTNFAVLLDFYGTHQPIDPVHDFSLSILSMIGLSLSIFGLGMTIVTFLFFKKLRKGRAQQTLFHMALSLLGSELVFLVGIKQTDNYYVCLSVAVLLHYFILVSFMWMLVEAILQYLTFVKVLGTYISRYTLKTAIPAWGIPLIPVITVLNIDYTLYKGRASYCWMNLSAFYYAFALPIGLIILFNIVMFIIIIISLGRRPRGLRAHQSKSKNNVAKTNLKAALTIFVLLGLTWSFGYMAIADARLVFQYIFTFLSSLQGFFIFILLVARRKQIRDQWMMICCKEGGVYRKRKSVSATNSNSNSTASNGSSSSGTSRRNLHNSSTRTIDTIIHNKSFDSLYFIPTSSIPTKNISPKQ